MQQAAERQQKKQKRKVAEGKLQARRKEMDKAMVCPASPYGACPVNTLLGDRCCQAIFLPTWSNRAV